MVGLIKAIFGFSPILRKPVKMATAFFGSFLKCGDHKQAHLIIFVNICLCIFFAECILGHFQHKTPVVELPTELSPMFGSFPNLFQKLQPPLPFTYPFFDPLTGFELRHYLAPPSHLSHPSHAI